MKTPSLYEEEFIRAYSSRSVAWDKIDGKTLLITGASGLIGSYLIMMLMFRNRQLQKKTKVIAVGRDINKLRTRFHDIITAYSCAEELIYLSHDVQEPLQTDYAPDYILHMASNTHPRLYATDPIGTEMTNILGTYNLLNLAAEKSCKRFLFCSSCDIYGAVQSDKPLIDEEDCGYINCNTLRAGYIEGKRAGEALCQAFKDAKGIDFVTARLCRIFGGTMQLSDSRAISQFIKNALYGEDIVLKSEGTQTFAYLYVYDAVTALLTILTNGKNGEAYNASDKRIYISLKELSEMLAEICGSKVVFAPPDAVEKKGASTFERVILNSDKLEAIGWKSEYDIRTGLDRTIRFISENLKNQEG